MSKQRKGMINGKWDPLYQAWRQAKGRCRNPRKPDYYRYGGRGVAFSTQWGTFEAFAADMGPHPGGGLTLERTDGAKGYEPGNCEWATREAQSRNRPGYVTTMETAQKIRDEYEAGGVHQSELAAKYDMSQVNVSKIIRRETWR